MARFDAFRGIRYNLDDVDLRDVVSPPYDVVSPAQRRALAARSPYSIVHVDQPDADRGQRAYDEAAATLRRWIGDGILAPDPSPSLYVYEMVTHDQSGEPARTLGVIGALEISPAEGPPVLPHEHTTPKAKTDRLQLIRATNANLSPIWGLSPSRGLTAKLRRPEPPTARWVDDDGTEHCVWAVSDRDWVAEIGGLVAAAPVLIADGHHRYEVSKQYRADQRAATGNRPGPYDFVMALIVELAEEGLHVLPIHRLIGDLPAGYSLTDALAKSFELSPVEVDPSTIAADMARRGGLALITAEGSWLMVPRPGVFDGVRDLDSSRLDHALRNVEEHSLRYQHGIEHVLDAVRRGDAQAGVLLRPVPLPMIEAIAYGGERMPPKSTYFNPKPSTGAVLMSLGSVDRPGGA